MNALTCRLARRHGPRTNTRRHPVRFDHRGSDEGRRCRSTPACSNAEGVGTKVGWGTPECCSRTAQPNTRQMRTRDPLCPLLHLEIHFDGDIRWPTIDLIGSFFSLPEPLPASCYWL